MILFDTGGLTTITIIIITTVVIVICLHIWCDAGALHSQIAGVRRGAQHAVSWNRSTSTTDNCLKFMLQIGQLFGVLFLFNIFAKNRHIC